MKNVDISSKKMEEFCISYLKDRGYMVKKFFGKPESLTELEVIKYFYSNVSKYTPGFVGFNYKEMDKDITILRRVSNRFSESGLSYDCVLKHIIELIDYIFIDQEKFGGPFRSFGIFSSVGFLENVMTSYYKDKTLLEEDYWSTNYSFISNRTEVDLKEIKNELLKLRGNIDGS